MHGHQPARVRRAVVRARARARVPEARVVAAAVRERVDEQPPGRSARERHSGGSERSGAFSPWFPYDRVGVVNAIP
eukprot:31495-Pelagococcus_subviridis.AAC.18